MSNTAKLDTTTPVLLEPVYITKPWGQEIWYTGMEARGESRVQTNVGQIGVSVYLQALGLLEQTGPGVLLLKVLDPKPVPVLGDLYFEVHEQKQEVYIVTSIDRAVWPDGTGAMRFGMNQQLRGNFDGDRDFRTAYRRAVAEYERIRRAIDEQGASIEPALEKQARQHMESFTALRRLQVGDVVRVPTWTPHSLQHGIRVVEFQTQTYERYIISFAQAVLTQAHWDSDHAIRHMHLDPPPPEQFEQVAPGVERIARFDDFNVWRVDLTAAGNVQLPAQLPYAVAMCIDGQARLGELELAPEQAAFIPPAALAGTRLSGHGRLLIAAPDL